MNRCGTCAHWFDLDADRKCPRLSKARAQAEGYIAANKGKPGLKPKVFEGTGVGDEACSSYAEAV